MPGKGCGIVAGCEEGGPNGLNKEAAGERVVGIFVEQRGVLRLGIGIE